MAAGSRSSLDRFPGARPPARPSSEELARRGRRLRARRRARARPRDGDRRRSTSSDDEPSVVLTQPEDEAKLEALLEQRRRGPDRRAREIERLDGGRRDRRRARRVRGGAARRDARRRRRVRGGARRRCPTRRSRRSTSTATAIRTRPTRERPAPRTSLTGGGKLRLGRGGAGGARRRASRLGGVVSSRAGRAPSRTTPALLERVPADALAVALVQATSTRAARRSCGRPTRRRAGERSARSSSALGVTPRRASPACSQARSSSTSRAGAPIPEVTRPARRRGRGDAVADARRARRPAVAPARRRPRPARSTVDGVQANVRRDPGHPGHATRRFDGLLVVTSGAARHPRRARRRRQARRRRRASRRRRTRPALGDETTGLRLRRPEGRDPAARRLRRPRRREHRRRSVSANLAPLESFLVAGRAGRRRRSASAASCGDRASRSCAMAARVPLHLRVGHRGPSGQDRRPDLRLRPRRRASRDDPERPRRLRDARSRPGSSSSPARSRPRLRRHPAARARARSARSATRARSTASTRRRAASSSRSTSSRPTSRRASTSRTRRQHGDDDPLDRVGAGDQGMMFGYATRRDGRADAAADHARAPDLQAARRGAQGGRPARTCGRTARRR